MIIGAGERGTLRQVAAIFAGAFKTLCGFPLSVLLYTEGKLTRLIVNNNKK